MSPLNKAVHTQMESLQFKMRVVGVTYGQGVYSHGNRYGSGVQPRGIVSGPVNGNQISEMGWWSGCNEVVNYL